jgi:hypothetical protein
MSWFSNFFKRVKNSWIRDVKPAVADAIDAFESQFGDFAYQAVTKLALTQLTGGQKFDEAVKQLGAEAKSKGWEIGKSVLMLLVQKAYVNFKASNETLDITAPPA